MNAIHLLEGRQCTPQPSRADAEAARLINLIRSSALFANLKPTAYIDILSCAMVRVFARGEVMFLQGHPVRQHVLLSSGIAKITQIGASGVELLLWVNGPSETVGIPNDAPFCWHACSARAVKRCHALSWEDSEFQSLIVKYPQIRTNISRMIAVQLGEMEKRFREIATKEVPMRLSFALLRLAAQVGTPTRDGIEVSLSFDELAQITGSTVFAVGHILSKWGREGLVAPRNRAVIVYDSGRLLLAGFNTAQISA